MRLDSFPFLRVAVLLMALLAFALFTACKSDSDGDETPDADETPAGDVTPADGGDGGDDGDGGDGGDASADLNQLAAQWADSQGLIAYEYTTEAGGQETSGAMTLYWQPPDWRIDYDADGSASTFMLVDGKTYVCGGESCLSYDSPDAAPVPFPFFGLFMDPEGIGSEIASSFAGVDFDTSSETIAGQSAQCFTSSVEAGGAGTEGEYCWAEDGGQLLRIRTETSVGGQTSSYLLEATDVGSVGAEDFEPPFPVTQFSIPTVTIPGQ